jgi:hypothetical protein
MFYQTRIYFWYAFLVIGALLGGILASNLYVNEPFWLMRVYYFIYGGTFFPLTMLYSLFRPPFIFSTLIPLFQKEIRDPNSILDTMFSFEKLDIVAANAKLGNTKTYARIFVIGYAAAYAAYFLVYYGFQGTWDVIKKALTGTGS